MQSLNNYLHQGESDGVFPWFFVGLSKVLLHINFCGIFGAMRLV